MEGSGRSLFALMLSGIFVACAAGPAPAQFEQIMPYSEDRSAPLCAGPADASKDCVVKVTFTAEPWVDVFLDAQYVGRTPIEDVRVKPRRYKLRLVNSSENLDYTTESTIAAPAEGDRLAVKFTLRN